MDRWMYRLKLAIKLVAKRPQKVHRLLTDAFRASHGAVPLLGRDFPRILLRTLVLLLRDYWEPQEALRMGLLNPDMPADDLCKYISKHGMERIQKVVNPASWGLFTHDKGIFYTHCRALGLPIPRLHAIFFKDAAGWSPDVGKLDSREEWARFLIEEMPPEFVIKPCRGSLGDQVKVLSKNENGEFTAGANESYSATGLYDLMRSDARFASYVVQERLRSHVELARLSGTENLQTVRTWTFVDEEGECRILYAHLKVIVGDNVIDNHACGKTGNMRAVVDLESGTLKPGLTFLEKGKGPAAVSAHPDTGVTFEGFRLPQWQEACSLVREAALKFLPVRVIGWDIALTASGPVLLEGNRLAEPPPVIEIREILSPLLHEVAPTLRGYRP